ncbi:2-C-methyl-D-erythritol 4-phosphate cytidylyltransferase [Oerskovia sp. M15]
MIRRIVETVKDGHQAVIRACPWSTRSRSSYHATRSSPVSRTASTGSARPRPHPPAGRADAAGVRPGAPGPGARGGAARARTEATAATDDASLVEALGEPVFVVPGHELAMKVTTARDFYYLETLLTEDAR